MFKAAVVKYRGKRYGIGDADFMADSLDKGEAAKRVVPLMMGIDLRYRFFAESVSLVRDFGKGMTSYVSTYKP